MTVTIQVGNSDDKLRQSAWAGFVNETESVIKTHCVEVHFAGGSPPAARWQNFAWVVECLPEQLDFLKRAVQRVRMKYGQSSVAYTEGKTQFV